MFEEVKEIINQILDLLGRLLERVDLRQALRAAAETLIRVFELIIDIFRWLIDKI